MEQKGKSIELCALCRGITEENTRYEEKRVYAHHASLFALQASATAGCSLCKMFFDHFPWKALQLSDQDLQISISRTATMQQTSTNDNNARDHASTCPVATEVTTSSDEDPEDEDYFESRIPIAYRLTGELGTGTSKIETIRFRPLHQSDYGRLFISREARKPPNTLDMVMSGRPSRGAFPIEMLSSLDLFTLSGMFYNLRGQAPSCLMAYDRRPIGSGSTYARHLSRQAFREGSFNRAWMAKNMLEAP